VGGVRWSMQCNDDYCNLTNLCFIFSKHTLDTAYIREAGGKGSKPAECARGWGGRVNGVGGHCNVQEFRDHSTQCIVSALEKLPAMAFVGLRLIVAYQVHGTVYMHRHRWITVYYSIHSMYP
jgi:hypothetical protein